MSYNRREPKPEIRNVDMASAGFTGSSDPRFRKVVTTAPAKVVHNDAHGSDNALLKLYSTGALKPEFTGTTCGNCLNFYPDPKMEKKGMGRCKARGYLRVHEDTPAEDTNGWTDPVSGSWFGFWPACPLYAKRERMSRK